MTLPIVYNPSPAEVSVTSTEIGYTKAKVRYGLVSDFDLSAVGSWIRVAIDAKNSAVYQQSPFDTDKRISTFEGLEHTTSYIASIAYLDDFCLSSSELIQSQYLLSSSELINITDVSFDTITPITITDLTTVTEEASVGNPFSGVSVEFTGAADELIIESLDLNAVGASWAVVARVSNPESGFTFSMLGGTYSIRYSSVKTFSDGDSDVTPPAIYPTSLVVTSGLSAPPEVENLNLAAYKVRDTLSTYQVRVSWEFPSDIASQNRKRNFTVSLAPNPGFTTNYASLDWNSVATEVAVDSPYVYSTFPYKTPLVIRIGVVGWGTEGSDYIYVPVYLTKDVADSAILGYLVPSEEAFTSNTKIQVDNEFIRAYKVYDPVSPSNNIKVFEVDANTGNVIIGTPGGVYGGGSTLTTAPFIFDSTSKKLQISGRTITDQIESASYVMSWIDAQPPSLRTVGKTAYSSNAPGIWMGYTNPTTFMFDLGDATNYIRWNGSSLVISGTVQIGLDGRTLGQAQKQVFIYKRSDVGQPATPTGGTFNSPVPGGWSSTVPAGIDDVYMCSRLFTTDAAPPQDSTWSTPSLFSPGAAAGSTAAYTWIKYADSVTGTGLSDSPTNKAYIGIAANKPSPTESENPVDYAWSLLTGQGVPGQDGVDGVTKYTWIKYSQYATGSPSMTNTPDANTLYIGIATNKDTEVESSIANDYTWSKFKGDTGVPGPSTYKSTAFIRSNSAPSTPTGGSYASPLPTSPAGWSDGIPAGSTQLWATTRVFSQDGLSPQQASWTAPVAMTNTATVEFSYSSILVSPGNPTDNPANWGAASESTVWLAQRTTTNGVLSSWQISKIKGEVGAPGSSGLNAKLLSLSASSMAITYLANNTQSPADQTVQFSVNRQNIVAATTWAAIDDLGVNVASLLTGTTNFVANLAGSSFTGRKFIKVTASAEGYSDSATIVKVQDGAAGVDPVVGLLTNESHAVSADKDGVVSSFTGAGGTFLVYKGVTNVTTSSVFSLVASSGATGSINATTGVYSVTAMSANQGTITLRAVNSGVTIDKVFTVTKSRTGITGSRGAGQYSAAYATPITPITNAMAVAASAVCPGGIPVVGDVVTLYNASDSNVSPVTMTYVGGASGTSTSWAPYIVRIDGNLLVLGSIAADKINITDLYSKSANVTGTLQVGGGDTFTVIDGISGGITAVVGGNTVFGADASGGFLQGAAIAAGSIAIGSLSPELLEYISNSSGGSPTLGGSQSYSAALVSGTFSLPAIDCAAGEVSFSISYGGNQTGMTSNSDPGGGVISYRFLRNGSPISSYFTATGTSTSFTGSEPGLGRYQVTMPSISATYNGTTTAGSQVFAIQFIVTKPVSSGGTQWTSPLGAFQFGAFQTPSGGSSGGGGSGSGAILTFGSYLTGGSYNGGTAATIAVNATNANTASTVVARDSAGNFAANIITASLAGSATSAATLSTSRSISITGDLTWTVNFNGSSAVTSAGTLSATGVSAGLYGSTTTVPVITIDAKGRVTNASSSALVSLTAFGTTIGPNNSFGMNIQSNQPSTYIYFQGGARGAIVGSASGFDFQAPGQGSNLVSMGTTGMFSTHSVYAPNFFATSDIRVKKDLKVIDGAIDRLRKLTGYTYLRTDLFDEPSAGIIAQQLRAVLPEAVNEKEGGGLTVNYGGAIALLIEVCKEQQNMIDELRRELLG